MKSSVLFTLAFAAALAAPTTKRASSFLFFGVNESCAEFGQGTYPGTLGTHYTWPDLSTISTLKNAGMNTFRVAFSMERLIPNTLTGSPDSAYMASLIQTVNGITSLGAYAVLDPHNYGRYYGNIITSTSDFAAFWTTVARQFADNDLVIFDTNNEYHTMDQTLVLNLNQAAINAIRATGATSQYIFVEGNAWSGAWSWTSVNTNMVALTDPEDKIIYEMHQYLDSDSSGTSSTCVSSTIGRERITAATEWLRANGKKGVLGEFAGAVNSVCQAAVSDMLEYLSDNSDVWTGGLWWAAGPWWGNYMFNLEPTSGAAYSTYMNILKPYFVDGSGSGSSSTTTTTTTTSRTTTTVPTTTTTTTSSRTTTTTTTGPTATSTGVAQRWAQCGGNGYTGPTVCASPYTCIKQNDWYSQCL